MNSGCGGGSYVESLKYIKEVGLVNIEAYEGYK